MSIKEHQRAKMAALVQIVEPDTETQEEIKPEKQKAVKTAPRSRAERPARAAGASRRAAATSLKQMTIKLEPEVRSRLLQESLRRKAQDSADWPIQQIVTEAVNAYLGGK